MIRAWELFASSTKRNARTSWLCLGESQNCATEYPLRPEVHWIPALQTVSLQELEHSTCSPVCTSPQHPKAAGPALQPLLLFSRGMGRCNVCKNILAGSISTVLTKPKARGIPVLWHQYLSHWEPEQRQNSHVKQCDSRSQLGRAGQVPD